MRWMLLFVMAGAGCSVISAEVRAVAEPDMPYGELLVRADDVIGKTVILGGYVLETDAGADESVLVVLQAPLDVFDLPGDGDDSQGRFLMMHAGYLDPAIYREGRVVTVAGVVIGVIGDTEECPARCLQIETRDLYLWDAEVKTPMWAAVGGYPYMPFGVYGHWGPAAPYYYGYARYPYSYRLRRRPPRPIK
jgi:outer membrane lipoprotein